MKKTLSYVLLFSFMVLSFYFTDKIMLFIDNKKPLMKEIKLKSFNYETKYVNSVINDNTIIPGIDGKKIDPYKSLIKMEDFGQFNDNYLVYINIKPPISLNDHKDKIIIKGNSMKRSVSLILEENKEHEDYFNNLKIKYDLLSSEETNFHIQREYLNGMLNKTKFLNVNALLNKHKLNSKICLISYNNKDVCENKKYFLVQESYNTSLNITLLLQKINSGDIIVIKKNTSLQNIDLIIAEIKRQNLKIIYLSELISEKN
jgi:hypothetical protein